MGFHSCFHSCSVSDILDLRLLRFRIERIRKTSFELGEKLCSLFFYFFFFFSFFFAALFSWGMCDLVGRGSTRLTIKDTFTQGMYEERGSWRPGPAKNHRGIEIIRMIDDREHCFGEREESDWGRKNGFCILREAWKKAPKERERGGGRVS